MSLFHTVPQDDAPQILNLIVEISKGGFVKYEYNHKLGVLEVDRVLYGPVHYPVAYCDVPGTWNKYDKDPLDAVVYTEGDLVPGCLVKGRVIGMLEMIDSGEKDHKIICVNANDPRYEHVKDVNDLRPYERKDLETFMQTYKYAQKGPDAVKTGDFLGPKDAYKLIEESIKEYQDKFKDLKL